MHVLKSFLSGSTAVICLLSLACGNSDSPSNAAPSVSLVARDSVPVDTLPPVEQIDSTAPLRLEKMGESGVPSETSKAPPRPGATTESEAARFKKNGFTDVAGLDPTILLDIRYATANNFTKKKIYDCPRCLLRPAAAQALVKAHKALRQRGMGLKMFDCYRPRPYQQRLWDAVPDADYVTPPAKGSMHSRGAAVDLTIVDEQGRELDMGTPYDFFGREAHTDYLQLPAKVLANRKLLRETLEAVGFQGIRTEWWHYSFRGATFPLSSFLWECD